MRSARTTRPVSDVPDPPRRRRMVAAGGGVPDLPAQLRRRRRDGLGDLAGRHLPDPVPGLAGHRRGLAQPVLPLGPDRRRVRRRRLPRRGPAARHAGRLRRDDRRAARATDQGHRRHRPEPHLQPARLVPRGAGRPEGIPGQEPVHLPRRPGPGRVAAALGLGLRVRRPGLDPRPRRTVVPAPVRRGAAGPELGEPRGPRRLRRRRCGSGPTAGSTGSGSTWRTAWPRTWPSRSRRCPSGAISPTGHCRPARTRCGTGTRCTTSTPNGGRSSTNTIRRGPEWPRPGCTPPGGRNTPAPTGWDRPSTSTCSKRTGAPESSCASSPTTSPTHSGRDRPCTWVLSNHDVVRHATRYGLPPEEHREHEHARNWLLSGGASPRLERGLGLRRARAAVLIDAGPARAPRTCTRVRNSACTRSPTFPPGSSRTPSTRGLREPRRAATAAGSRCRGRPTARRSGSGPVPPTCRSRPGSARSASRPRSGIRPRP